MMFYCSNSNQQDKEEKQSKGNTEESGAKKSSKLDPSLLLTINMNIDSKRTTNEDQSQYGMIMRRRGVLCQYSAKDETIILPLNKTFLPKEEIREVDDNESPLSSSSEQHKNDNESTVKKSNSATRRAGGDCSSEQFRAKIFSISTSSFLLITAITLAGILCLFVCNRATVLVNAQYSSFGQTKNGNNDNKIKSDNNNVRTKMTRQISNGQHSAGYSVVQPNSMKARNSRSNAILQDQSETQLLAPAIAPNKHQRLHHYNSIDRFDSGEQIKPPSLRQTTTLKPPATNSQQVSSNKVFNLQTAASQESYLSPEDREQLLKNHYEGKNYDQQSSQDSMSAPERDQYEKPTGKQRWSQPDGPYDLGSAKSNNLEHQASKPRDQSSSASTNSDNEDSDYEDEPHEESSDQKRANNVPEIRRPTSAASHHYKASSRYRGHNPIQNAAVAAPSSSSSSSSSEGEGRDESEPGDDYGGANDEAHFSRVSNQQGEGNSLNPSASYNQEKIKAQNKAWSQANLEYENPRHGGSGSSNNEGPTEHEHHGFGPGPNEAYMFDRAESGRPSGEHEEEGMNLGPGGDPPDSSNANEEGSRFDRRLLNQYPEGSTSNSIAQGSPAKHGKSLSMQQQGPSSNSNESSDLDDADENGDNGSEDSAASPSSSSSSKAESTSRLNPIVYGPRINNVIPKASASAPAPLSTLSSSGSPPAYSLPISITPQAYKSSIISSHQTINQRQPVHSGVGGQSRVNNLITLSSNHQNKASKMPYNPQDNPSHAGKYFIN